MADFRENLRGGIIMAASMAAFAVNDTFTKAVGGEMGVMQVVFLRSVVVAPLILALAWMRGALTFNMAGRDAWLLGLRCVTEVLAAWFFLTALFNMPLANATAILQVTPLVVTLAGFVFFREQVGLWRLSAILVGFVGVMMIVRPGGADFTIYSVWALAAVLAVVARDLVTRRMSGALPSLTVASATAITVGAAAGIGAMFEPWEPVTLTAALKIGGASGAIFFAYLCSVMAMRMGDIGFVSPLRYTALIWALMLGWLAFGHFPEPLPLAGGALVLAAGLFTYMRERHVARQLARSAA
ncbi:DMT family transporter [Vannielia sp.]|uniref:DMT family transporter n=1 Tax=Vannielia sp. TaxID=2813045 RepID=UPI0026271E98|nr:DMT family transporter [Vannielia sp.]MDF1874020.1 DMT family transporter [Vannielia sp.]